jgi:alcohol dehydrogenase
MSDSARESARLPEHVRFGHGAVATLPELVRRRGAQRILLVCGRRSFEASGAASVLPELNDIARTDRWSDFSPNTDVADVARGLDVLRDARPDLVLGVGGGSTLDMAKLLCAFSDLPPENDVRSRVQSGTRVESRRPGLVLVPTTSGSGSEATHFAVAYVGDEKYSVAGPGMLPDAVVLDPHLSLSGSNYQRATSGVDAVCQAIESLWATNATSESRDFARRALDLLLPALPPFTRDDPDDECSSAMALGSYLAGAAINISKTTAAHALSYGLTKRHGISHGHAVALTLRQFLRMHWQADPSRLQPGVDPDGHRQIMDEIVERLEADDGESAKLHFTELMRRIDLEPDAARLGVKSAVQRRELAGAVNAERLGNNPVALTNVELEEALTA